MRPIDKGTVPLDNKGQPKTVTTHTQWRGYLINRIGGYCSYCEMKLNDLPQVEHVVAKTLDPTLILDWDNLLLACGACNRTKDNKSCTPSTHYLPDVHNTYLAFDYQLTINSKQPNEAAVFITISSNTPPYSQKATATIELCGLDRDTTSDTLKLADLRWRYRQEALANALVWKKEWQEWGHKKVDKFINLLLTAALPKGFFSIWFSIFQGEKAVREALVKNFKGTAINCFDTDYNPIWRNAPADI